MHLLVNPTSGNFIIYRNTAPPVKHGHIIVEPDEEMLAVLETPGRKKWQPKQGSETGELVNMPAVVSVPMVMEAWQAKAIMAVTPFAEGVTLLDAVLDAIAQLPEGLDKVVIQSALNHNARFRRDSPAILAISSTLGLTDEQLNNLFVAGAALAV